LALLACSGCSRLASTQGGRDWLDSFDKAMVVPVRRKRRRREIGINGVFPDATCPLVVLVTWFSLGRITHGPLYGKPRRKFRKPFAPSRLACTAEAYKLPPQITTPYASAKMARRR